VPSSCTLVGEIILEDYSQKINGHDPLGMVGELDLDFGEILMKLWFHGRTLVVPHPFKVKLVGYVLYSLHE
jgi:hypothetical protein